MSLQPFLKKGGLWIVSLVYLVALLLVRDTPVFWDMYGQVKTARYFLETGFTDLFPNGNSYSDNGHLPLYPLYLALLFKVLGFKLWVAHFSVFPFLLGTLVQLKKFCSRYLHEARVFIVLLLTLISAPFISQSIYFSAEIAMVFLSLWLLNALLSDRGSHIAIAAVFLCLLNLRGIAFCGTLFVYFVFAKKNKNGWFLISGALAWITWLLVHYKISGWFFAGEEIKEFRRITSVGGMGRNLALCIWKLIDLGAVFAWVVIMGISLKKKDLNEPVKLLLLASLSVMIICIPFTNPISNRYFLLVYVLLLPVFIQMISVVPIRLQIIVGICFALVLFSNNGVTYPNKYGNAWDCSLKSYPYFELRKQLDEYVAAQKIPPSEVEAGFQLYFNDKDYLMNGNDREYSLLSDTEMPTHEYVADSDICNNYNAEREQFLLQNYEPHKLFENGAVYIRLYKRKPRP